MAPPARPSSWIRSHATTVALPLLPLLLLVGFPEPAAAYVGPGAGFVFLGSFLIVLFTGLAALLSMLAWPFRMAWRFVRRSGRPRPRIQRLIIVGFDGQDPGLTDRFMGEGKLPHFQRLAEEGCYHRLRSTFPSVSPVAWSSFSTGTHPAKHNIFDFLDRDRRTYLPVLSSTRIGRPERCLELGPYRVPLGKPDLRLLRRSRPFWSILGEHQIWSTVLRVPITFPPERFYGAQLSAMCVPDLLGSQGTFTLFSTRDSREGFKEGGRRVRLERDGDRLEATLEGPPNELRRDAGPLKLPLVLEPDGDRGCARIEVGGTRITGRVGELSDWIEVAFRAAPGIKVRGTCRAMLTEMDEHVSLYVSPIHIDPEKPAMPISHPSYYAVYLAKKLGKYATLGLAEDTWALNEGVIDDATFLELTYDIDAEREEMLLAALDKLRKGSLTCVFDATDRIQHMFWRYIEPDHPATARDGGSEEGRATGSGDAPADSGDGGPGATRDGPADTPGERTAGGADAIEELYRHNDALLGRVRERLRDGDVLIVLSDHGFTSFRRGVNLNAWLYANGYLALKDGADGSSEWLRDVDWGHTRAYALGLTGLFLNVQGRESEGIVGRDGEAAALRAELSDRLTGLADEETGEVAIREAFDTAGLYAGPYLENAPDLIVGYNAGYRASWDGATGVVRGPIFEDNARAWSGDHCVDPRIVPGVFFCDRAIDADDPSLIDIAPTALWLFGIEPPPHMDGRSLFREESSA